MAKHEKKKFHPAAEIFPLLEGKEFAELVESIKKNGQQVPIQLLNDAIIDGRNRYLACLEAGEEPWFATADLDGMTPLDYVLVLNKDRRHLDPSQRSMVAARVKEYHAAQAKERQGKRNDLKKDIPEKLPECSGDARDKAGEALHVSGRSVDHAAKVIKEGTKELQAAVDSGQASVSAAAKVAELPEQEQRKVVETAAKHPKGMKKGIAEAAKKLSEEKKPAPPKISGGTTFNVDEIEAVIEHEAEAEAPETDVSIVLDEIGRPIPPALKAHHATAAVISSTATKLDAVRRAVEEISKQPGGEFLSVSEICELIRTVKGKIAQARYWSECPRCRGKLGQKCDRCSGHGFLSFDRRGKLSTEDKVYLGVAS